MNTKFTRFVIECKKNEKVFQVKGVYNVAAKKSPPIHLKTISKMYSFMIDLLLKLSIWSADCFLSLKW